MTPEGYLERRMYANCRCSVDPVFPDWDPVAEAEAICRAAASP